MSVQVAPLTAAREQDYTHYVAAHPDALSTYTLGYRDLLAELLGCRPRYALALREDAVVGVMPLMSTSGAMGTVLNALPYFGSQGGPLADDGQACEALREWYAGEARADGVVAATVVANPLTQSGASVLHDLVDLRVTHVTPLAGDGEPEARIRGSIEGSARRNIGKAERCGTKVRVENDSFDELLGLHRASMKEIGGQAKTAEFFAAVPRHLRAGADYDIYVARIGAEAVAALLVLYCAETADYFVPAVSPAHRGEQPMAPILLRAMADAARRGLTRWHWGGSWPSHESLQRFKAKWGGIPAEYRYETQLNDRELLRARSAELLEAYPGFYVVPFSSLEEG